MKLKIKKLHPDSVIPKQMTEGAAGFDLTAISSSYNGYCGYVEYGTGLAIEIPQGYAGFIFPRSSISEKPLYLCNSVGVIDSDYRGEVKCRFRYTPLSGTDYDVGDRVAQLVVLPVQYVEIEEVEELTKTWRGAGAFGSTNR